MKKYKALIIVLLVLIASSCTTSKLTYNSDKETLADYHRDVQNHYIKMQKKHCK